MIHSGARLTSGRNSNTPREFVAELLQQRSQPRVLLTTSAVAPRSRRERVHEDGDWWSNTAGGAFVVGSQSIGGRASSSPWPSPFWCLRWRSARWCRFPVLSNRDRPTADQVAIIRFPSPEARPPVAAVRRPSPSKRGGTRASADANRRAAGRRSTNRCTAADRSSSRARQSGCRFPRAGIPEVRTARRARARAVRPCQGDQGKAHRSSRPEFHSPIARRTLHSFVTRS